MQRSHYSAMGFIAWLTFLSMPLLADIQTIHSIYDAKGNLMASCGEEGCEYLIYQGVSRIGTVKEHQFNHQANGLNGKAGEMVRDQTGTKNSQLWITDFHGSVVAKLTAEEPEIILFDAFGGVLNESTNTEGCKDYHYTDKPRVGCTSLHNFNARFYDPKIGRFITSDPIEQHNLNWYVYANNNPLSFVDPTGMASIGDYIRRMGSLMYEHLVNQRLVDQTYDTIDSLNNSLSEQRLSSLEQTRQLQAQIATQMGVLEQLRADEQSIFRRQLELFNEFTAAGITQQAEAEILRQSQEIAERAFEDGSGDAMVPLTMDTKVPGFPSSPSEQIRTEIWAPLRKPETTVTRAPGSWVFKPLPHTTGLPFNNLNITYTGDLSDDAKKAALLTALVALMRAMAQRSQSQVGPAY